MLEGCLLSHVLKGINRCIWPSSHELYLYPHHLPKPSSLLHPNSDCYIWTPHLLYFWHWRVMDDAMLKNNSRSLEVFVRESTSFKCLLHSLHSNSISLIILLWGYFDRLSLPKALASSVIINSSAKKRWCSRVRVFQTLSKPSSADIFSHQRVQSSKMTICQFRVCQNHLKQP